MRHTESRHVTLADQAANRYPRFGFDLPEGVTSFEVTLVVEGGPDARIDLGCEGPTAWRGWSGGARRTFVVSEDDATPGYLPGEVLPGRWYVVLGLHTLPSTGADVTVTVEMPALKHPDHGPVEEPVPREARGSDRDLPAPAGLRWYAGDTHAHTLHSDGALSIWEVANEGVRSGLDFLCITDHNTTSHHQHLGPIGRRHGITLVPGQEVTTARGHANAFGEIGFVDFRLPAQEWADLVTQRGGLMSINHPVSGDCSWLHAMEREPGAVELYHSTWYQEPNSTAALAWFRRWRHDAVLLGGGDFHSRDTPLRPGLPTTWVAAEEHSAEAILDAMRSGRTTVTAAAHFVAPDEARPSLGTTAILIRQREELLALAALGLTLVSGSGRRLVLGSDAQRVAAPAEDGPYRLEDSKRAVLALSS